MKNRFWFILVLLLVVALLYLRFCDRRPATSIETITVKRDTVYQIVKDSTGWIVPKPKVIIKRESRLIPVVMPVDSAELLRMFYNAQLLQEEYFITRYYEDTTHIEHGYVITRDTVTENRITARKVITALKIPTITETITVQAPRRVHVYAGLGILGGRTDLIRGFEGTLTLKSKSDQLYEVGGVMLNDGNIYFKGAIKFKLSFKKRK